MKLGGARLLAALVVLSSSACEGGAALHENDSAAPDAQGDGGVAGDGPPEVGPEVGEGEAPLDLRDDMSAVWPGAGCGKPLPPSQVPTKEGSPVGYTPFAVMGTGANLTDVRDPTKAARRTFWVRVPADYDPTHPYRVVFLGQACGGYRSANTSTLSLFRAALGGAEEAIYVAIDLPEDMANQDCYDDQSGLSSQEWEAFQLFMRFVDTNYCTNLNQIYVAGYNTGAWMANMWGCYFAGWPRPARQFAPTYHVRAQVAISGGEPPVQPTCGGPVAALFVHSTIDALASFSGEVAALARVGRQDGCDTTYASAPQAPWHADDRNIGLIGCQSFTACGAANPVVFCTTQFPAQSGPLEQDTVPAITHFFDELEGTK